MVYGSAAYFIPPQNARFFAFSRRNVHFKKSGIMAQMPEVICIYSPYFSRHE
jgi:hypothetical protein